MLARHHLVLDHLGLVRKAQGAGSLLGAGSPRADSRHHDSLRITSQ